MERLELQLAQRALVDRAEAEAVEAVQLAEPVEMDCPELRVNL